MGEALTSKRSAICSRVNLNFAFLLEIPGEPSQSGVRPTMGTAFVGTAGMWAEF